MRAHLDSRYLTVKETEQLLACHDNSQGPERLRENDALIGKNKPSQVFKYEGLVRTQGEIRDIKRMLPSGLCHPHTEILVEDRHQGLKQARDEEWKRNARSTWREKGGYIAYPMRTLLLS